MFNTGDFQLILKLVLRPISSLLTDGKYGEVLVMSTISFIHRVISKTSELKSMKLMSFILDITVCYSHSKNHIFKIIMLTTF